MGGVLTFRGGRGGPGVRLPIEPCGPLLIAVPERGGGPYGPGVLRSWDVGGLEPAVYDRCDI